MSRFSFRNGAPYVIVSDIENDIKRRLLLISVFPLFILWSLLAPIVILGFKVLGKYFDASIATITFIPAFIYHVYRGIQSSCSTLIKVW